MPVPMYPTDEFPPPPNHGTGRYRSNIRTRRGAYHEGSRTRKRGSVTERSAENSDTDSEDERFMRGASTRNTQHSSRSVSPHSAYEASTVPPYDVSITQPDTIASMDSGQPSRTEDEIDRARDRLQQLRERLTDAQISKNWSKHADLKTYAIPDAEDKLNRLKARQNQERRERIERLREARKEDVTVEGSTNGAGRNLNATVPTTHSANAKKAQVESEGEAEYTADNSKETPNTSKRKAK
jgi:hypothetical protein